MMHEQKSQKIVRHYNQNGCFCPKCGETLNMPDIRIKIEMSGRDNCDFDACVVDPTPIFYQPKLEFSTPHSYKNQHIVSAYCPNCNNQMIWCDAGLTEHLAKLNKAGAFTVFSCSGHTLIDCYNRRIESVPYISFGTPLLNPILKELVRNVIVFDGKERKPEIYEKAADDPLLNTKCLVDGKDDRLQTLFRVSGSAYTIGSVESVYINTDLVPRYVIDELIDDGFKVLVNIMLESEAGKSYCAENLKKYGDFYGFIDYCSTMDKSELDDRINRLVNAPDING